jgi:membrane-associated phospholipid phosphatase
MGTGNHFALDVVAGILVAAIAIAVVYGLPLWTHRRRPASATA